MYHFREVEEKLGSLVGHQYKCFLQLPKEVSQSEQDLIEDVEETLYKLQRVSMKLDPSECAFGMEEDKFLGYMEMAEGIKADPEKVGPYYEVLPQKAQSRVNVVTDGGRNFERFRSLRTIGSMGSKIKDIPHLICPKEGGRRPNSEEVFWTTRASVAGTRQENSKEGSKAFMVLVDPEEREYSHAIRLNIHASEEDMDCETLLAELIAFAGKGMKDLHVFVDSRLLVDQVEGNRTPRTEGAKRYREEIMDVMAPFHRFRITHLPKALNSKAKALMGLTSI
ncbi:reverse transcriptase domain-containing protein [Tanacetum coccineum]|uniref:Reverse transcriptase domain-containing protein n=1 Tax=Tanacetum coccineum TaxID=301880 RepID=A0ABQ4XU55_9ASTR